MDINLGEKFILSEVEGSPRGGKNKELHVSVALYFSTL